MLVNFSSHLSPNFIDRLLAKIDGEVATVWISQLMTLDHPPDAMDLRRAFISLVGESPRLNLCWDEIDCNWRRLNRSDEQISDHFVFEDVARGYRELADSIAQFRIDLKHHLPLRVGLWRLKDGEPGRWLLSIQVHHAIADARGLMFLTERFWEHVNRTADPSGALLSLGATDFDFYRAVFKHLPYCLLTAAPRYRTLAKRAASLKNKASPTLGVPVIRSIRFPLPPSFVDQAQLRAELFFSAVVGAVIEGNLIHEPNKYPLRFRIPVDIRAALGLEPGIGNACSAITLELKAEDLKEKAVQAPAELGEWMNGQLKSLYARGAHWSTLLECLLASTFVSSKSLKAHARPDLLEAPRSNSLVVTYVGQMGRCHARAPFRVNTLCTQTPTWGVNGLTYEGYLYLNFTAFSGIWNSEELDSFSNSSLSWIKRTYGIQGEVIGL